MAGRRPTAWNQWPEVIGREARQPRFVGDLPHGWVASDFMRATLDLFAYERDGDHALVLAAGVPPAWLREGGVTVKALRTPYGELSYSLRRIGNSVVLQVSGSSRVPPGGFVLAWPGPEAVPRQGRVNGRPVQWQGGELRFHELPARVVIGARS
jgi:hypothetical protein